MLINYKDNTDLIIGIAVPRDKSIQDKKLKKWQISVIKNWARTTVEIENHGDPSSC